MGNGIHHHRIVIDYDVWQPFQKEAEKDIDDIADLIRTKKLFKHCGNVHTIFLSEKDLDIKKEKE